ncbi:MAG: pyridoxamine 5'-phosphate oxidase [Puniceicoccales bacterium]|jgi:pyridoxamine 5'-phosphate oxidase|nr:pyridoxamine 5'-phosphate oxidase [Puniceicoccales bacterium]
MDIADLRQEYSRAGLERADLAPSPLAQFELWFRQANEAGLLEPNAMSIATAGTGGAPTCRTVLLKYFDERGFVFFTNYTSRKAADIAANPRAALLFPWLALERQVAITGSVEKISAAESLRYFLRRPHGSQLGAWVSHQSSVISSRQLLLKKMDEMRRKFLEGHVPLPDFWGGFRVVPQTVEFWQGRPNRLHDRFLYTRDDAAAGGWRIERLAP